VHSWWKPLAEAAPETAAGRGAGKPLAGCAKRALRRLKAGPRCRPRRPQLEGGLQLERAGSEGLGGTQRGTLRHGSWLQRRWAGRCGGGGSRSAAVLRLPAPPPGAPRASKRWATVRNEQTRLIGAPAGACAPRGTRQRARQQRGPEAAKSQRCWLPGPLEHEAFLAGSKRLQRGRSCSRALIREVHTRRCTHARFARRWCCFLRGAGKGACTSGD